jgi:hypothetical protein
MTSEPLLAESVEKLRAALTLLFASADDHVAFDAARPYTPKEREPYDALSDRFLRGFESSLKFFRTWERVREAAASESFRDQLLRMEKMGFISSHELWLVIRDLRNRVAHEYIPGELAHLYAGIVDTAVPEFRRLLAEAGQRLS